MPLLAAATTEGRLTDEVAETGIKVIDVMCPIRAGGSVAIAGEYGAGITVVMEEIVRRISRNVHPVTMFVLIPLPSKFYPPSLDENYSFADELKAEGYSEGTVGAVKTFFLRGVDRPWTAEMLASLAAVDTVVHLSREMILRKTYPGVDVRTARSRLIDENRIAAEDVALARTAKDTIATARRAEHHSELAPDRCPDRSRAEAAGVLLAAFLRRRAVHQAAGLSRQPRRRLAGLPRNPRRPA